MLTIIAVAALAAVLINTIRKKKQLPETNLVRINLVRKKPQERAEGRQILSAIAPARMRHPGAGIHDVCRVSG